MSRACISCCNPARSSAAGPLPGQGDHTRGPDGPAAADAGQFDSKEQLFQTAAEEVMERWGQMIDRASASVSDPAEVFAVGLRISGRLGWTHRDIAGFLTGAERR
jgi:hypothetical protein